MVELTFKRDFGPLLGTHNHLATLPWCEHVPRRLLLKL